MESIVIENISPSLNCGRYAVKRRVGENLHVEADIFKDGHDEIAAVVKWRKTGEKKWRESPMMHIDNDRWGGSFPIEENALYVYTVEAWSDTFASWAHEVHTKWEAKQSGFSTEQEEGAVLMDRAAKRAKSKIDKKKLRDFARLVRESNFLQIVEISKKEELCALMATWAERSLATEAHPYFKVFGNRRRANFSAWYEFFPRSAEGKAHEGSTFRQALGRIDDAKAMGFDVIYFPPIHPIGMTKRKGKNNSLVYIPGDPGVPYAIGNRHQGVHGGGHRDVAPELGTLEDFEWFVKEIRSRDMEVALDFAINCSPDHPYVHDHPEWFFHRPDGTIKYAENPPKKYEDVYPLNFGNSDWRGLWEELRDVLLFWVARGVRIFRVDNPHTKPVAFWEWVIQEVHTVDPGIIFLSEAFTRPKMMRVLAKAGFSQSYTYFTWRNTKQEITDYFTELTQSEMKEYFQANLFTNTPDILPFYLQEGGPPAFRIRAVLAATLSSVYGIYSGFELCENAALPGREEYADSEKYQFKGRDWDAPGNIKETLSRLNHIRNENPALQESLNLRFHEVDNNALIFFSKATADKKNIILVIVNLDFRYMQSGFVEVPLEEWGWSPDREFCVRDLLSDESYVWKGTRNYVELSPLRHPAHILRLDLS